MRKIVEIAASFTGTIPTGQFQTDWMTVAHGNGSKRIQGFNGWCWNRGDMMKVTKEQKEAFWNEHKDKSRNEFVKLARKKFGYSPKTINWDIYNGFAKIGGKLARD